MKSISHGFYVVVHSIASSVSNKTYMFHIQKIVFKVKDIEMMK